MLGITDASMLPLLKSTPQTVGDVEVSIGDGSSDKSHSGHLWDQTLPVVVQPDLGERLL